MTLDQILSFVRVLKSCFEVEEVHLTGGEPLLRADMPELVSRLVREDIRDVALTTNGQTLKKVAGALKTAGLRRVNISLDSLNPATFHELTGGKLGRTLDGLHEVLSNGFSPVKLNVLVLRHVNDGEVVDIAQFGLARGCHARFLELMPVGAAAASFRKWFVSSAEVRERLSEVFELSPLPFVNGSPSRNYLAEDGRLKGVIGFISPHSRPSCDGCRRLRLTARGELLGCLARRERISVASLLPSCERDYEARSRLLEAVETALGMKRERRRFAAQSMMVGIGG